MSKDTASCLVNFISPEQLENMTHNNTISHPCDLNSYLKVLEAHQHNSSVSSVTVLDTETSNKTAETTDERNELRPEARHQEAVDTSSSVEEGHVTSLIDELCNLAISPAPFDDNIMEPAERVDPAERLDDERCNVASCDDLSRHRPLSMFRHWRSRNMRLDGNASESEEVDHSDRRVRKVTSADFKARFDNLRPRKHAQKMRKWKIMARGHSEKMLLDYIVKTDNIAPNYEDIQISKSKIAALERCISVSLHRPQAFAHGILKGSKITGGLLCGPPGTGKSLLARSIAKQSNFNMLSVSTSGLWQKCLGDEEEMIKAIFSMAQKLHPCIIFVDEAEAFLGARKICETKHSNAMLNQFLTHWDCSVTDPKAPFVLLATVGALALDPAVLRRAPVQIHLDIPTVEERLGILRILLREEALHPSLDLTDLANRTQNYTGSDLKKLCVMAATNCVHEQPRDTFERVLTREHFLAAFDSIKATNTD